MQSQKLGLGLGIADSSRSGYADSTSSAGGRPSPTLVSAGLSLNDEEFPELGGGSTSSSAAAGNPRMAPQKGGRRGSAAEAFSIVQTEDIASTSPSRNAPGFRKIHNRACEEDDRPLRASAKGDRKGSARGQSGGYTAEKKSRGNQDRIYFLGRLLSSILRHRALDLNLQIRNDGYVVVNDLLKLGIKTMAGLPLSVYTVDDIMKAVEQDSKQRFGLLMENGVLLIRANQGHSIKVIESDKLLKPVLLPDEIPVCVHGTLMSNLDSILKTGLKKMGRNHVHFASGLPREDGVISGMRFSSEVLIYLDSKKALQDGMKLYMSDNSVILTEGFNGVVPPKYFAQVAKWSKGIITPLPFDAKS